MDYKPRINVMFGSDEDEETKPVKQKVDISGDKYAPRIKPMFEPVEEVPKQTSIMFDKPEQPKEPDFVLKADRSEKKEIKDTILTKVARFVLPKSLEQRWGLSEKSAGDLIRDLEDDKMAYARSKKQEETLKKEGVTEQMKVDPYSLVPEDYTEPTGFFDTAKESVVRGYYTSMKEGIGGFAEMMGQKMGNRDLMLWGEQFGDKATAHILKHPELLPDQTIKHLWEGGLTDPRSYGKILGELIPFMTTIIGTSIVGGLIGGVPGATAGAWISGITLNGGTAYRGYINSGMPKDKAATTAGVFAVIATYLENAMGVMPQKIGGQFFTNTAKQITYKSFTQYLYKELGRMPLKVLKSALGEMTEEGLQQFAENLGMRYFDKHADIFSGIAESLEGGLIGGLGFGGFAAVPSFRGVNINPEKPLTKLPDKPKTAEPAKPLITDEGKIDMEEFVKELPNSEIVSSADVRDKMDALGERMDEVEGAERTVVIQESNKYRDQYNLFVEQNKDTVFEIPQKDNASSIAKIEVVKFDDGKWAMSVNVNTHTAGFSSPFTGTYDTQRAAIEEAIKNINDFIKNERKRQPSATDTKILDKIEKQINETKIEDYQKGTQEVEKKKAIIKLKRKEVAEVFDETLDRYKENLKSEPGDEFWTDKLNENKEGKTKILKKYKDEGIDIDELQSGIKEREEKLKIAEAKVEESEKVHKEKIGKLKAEKKDIVITEQKTDIKAFVDKRVKENKTFYEKKAQGSAGASVGTFKEEEEITLGDADKIRPIEFPELVDLARDLMGDVPTLKKFPKARGTFYSEGKGKIKMHPSLFAKGQEKQLAAVLAHELGHLTDYLPGQTLARGNMLGRLLSLRTFLKNTYGYLSVNNKELRTELKKASLYWRPTDNWNAYRNSAKELYADAISMLFVNPGKLQKLAPKFYKTFFENLDKKPEVKRAYFDMQDILKGDKASVIKRRRKGVREMFDEADYKSKDLQEIKEKEKKNKAVSLWDAFKFSVKSVNQPVYDKVNKIEKEGGYVNPDYNPKYLLEERNYLGSLVKAQFEKYVQPIYENLQENDIDWGDLGEMMMYERIVNGDRSEMANPRGIAPAEAQEMLDNLNETLGEEKAKILEENLTKFRQFNEQIIADAHKVGLITDKMYKQIQENPAYSPFRVIEHMEENVGWQMKQQVGTLKDIDNPATAMLLKIMSTIRATHSQKVRVGTIELLEKNYSKDIEDSKTKWTGKTHEPIDSRNRKQELITYYDKGVLRGKYVDPYIAMSLENNTIGRNNMTMKLLSPITFLNRNFFRPVFVIYNPGWIPFNFVRDFTRFWKNTPNMSLLKSAKRYLQAGKVARARVSGREGKGKELLAEMEQNMVINTLTWNDLLAGENTEDKQIVDILQRTGVLESEKKKHFWALRPIVKLGRAIRTVGDYVETLPKAAAFIEVRENLTPEKASYIRKKAGSPDFFEKGHLTPATNEIFLFSNPFIQAWFADYEVATQAETRSGFWFKTATREFVPKLLMFAAMAGLMGDDAEEIMKGASEYDKTNYFIIPIGIDKINGKSIYFRLPTDETGRVLGGIFWKLLQTAEGDKNAMKQITQVLDYAGGQAPGFTPSVSTLGAIKTFAQGRNPYDDFRGRNVISKTEFQAGGWYKTKPFLGWIFQQSGGNIFMRLNVSTYAPRAKSIGEKILSLPLANNIIGRWIKISDYGVTERLREVGEPPLKEAAIQTLEERKIINKYLKIYNDSDKKLGTGTRLERELLVEAIGEFPKSEEEKRRGTSLKRKFRLGVAYGQNDPKISEMIGATNNVKVALLKEFEKELSTEEFKNLKKLLLKFKVVSSNLLREYHRNK